MLPESWSPWLSWWEEPGRSRQAGMTLKPWLRPVTLRRKHKKTNWIGLGLSKRWNPPSVMPVLQQGYTQKSFPISSTNWRPSIETCAPMAVTVTQKTQPINTQLVMAKNQRFAPCVSTKGGDCTWIYGEKNFILVRKCTLSKVIWTRQQGKLSSTDVLVDEINTYPKTQIAFTSIEMT